MYIFEISCLSVASFAIIFSHSESCLFTLLTVSFVVQKLLSLIRSHLFIFACISNILGGGSYIIYETSHQSRFDAQYWMLGAGALGRPRGMVQGGKREEGSGWGTRVYLWRIHVDIWQNQYNIVKLKNKIKKIYDLLTIFSYMVDLLSKHVFKIEV